MRNIVLIGMPACGKSTVGVLLAKQLGYRFIDSDLLIQEREGKLLHELIATRGIEGFLGIENEVNASIEAVQTVISTGGSVVYCEEAMEHLRAIGRVVYLQVDFETLQTRLGDFTHRGVVMRNGGTLREMYDERVPLYEKYADVIVPVATGDALGKTLEQTLAALDL
ncbi:MAG: shikimate kinase [Clostridia bacterium]|nr:shikimate kinase [Clostridia bacterium]